MSEVLGSTSRSPISRRNTLRLGVTAAWVAPVVLTLGAGAASADPASAVTADPPTAGATSATAHLASTGVEAGPVVALGVAATVAGAALVAASRRANRPQE